VTLRCTLSGSKPYECVDAMPAGRYVSTRRVSAGERATDEVEGKLRLLVRGARTGFFAQ
jgi:hypothetical protein